MIIAVADINAFATSIECAGALVVAAVDYTTKENYYSTVRLFSNVIDIFLVSMAKWYIT